MPSTSMTAYAYAASSLTILSLLSTVTGATHLHPARGVVGARAGPQLNAMTQEGCYSSSAPMTDQGPWTYQTSGYCQPICVGQNKPVMATTNGSNCWCGDQLPALDTKVDSSQCNTPCNGYDQEMCTYANSHQVSTRSANIGRRWWQWLLLRIPIWHNRQRVELRWWRIIRIELKRWSIFITSSSHELACDHTITLEYKTCDNSFT